MRRNCTWNNLRLDSLIISQEEKLFKMIKKNILLNFSIQGLKRTKLFQTILLTSLNVNNPTEASLWLSSAVWKVFKMIFFQFACSLNFEEKAEADKNIEVKVLSGVSPREKNI